MLFPLANVKIFLGDDLKINKIKKEETSSNLNAKTY